MAFSTFEIAARVITAEISNDHESSVHKFSNYCPEATFNLAGLSQAGSWGGFSPSQFWAEQLTLSQPGGQIMPTMVLRAPPDFQTL